MTHHRHARCFFRAAAITAAALALPACDAGGGRTVRQARTAEQRGEAHMAYEYYCQAARRDPGDARVAASIQRLAPTAAAYWESQAKIASAEGRCADAWKMGMKSLDIRPDQPGMAAFVERLEREHPDAVAPVRAEWEQTGRLRIAVASGAPSSDLTGDEALARANAPQRHADDAAAPDTTGASREDDADDVDAGDESDDAGQVEPAPRRRSERPPPRRTAAPPAPREPAPPETPPADARSASRAEPLRAPVSEFAVLYTLSRDDERHKERVRLADGIFMELRDVSRDGTVDLDLDDGDERVQKIRGMKMGQSKLFRGRSGRWFRFSLIDVTRETETIRVGVMPG